MARKAWLRDHLPRLPFARRAVRRFMPGETADEAIAAADALLASGIGVLFTHLGENLTRASDADAVAAHYHGLLGAIADRSRPPELSVKLSQLGLDFDRDRALAHALELARHAEAVGSWFWLDMEASATVEATIAIYERLTADHQHTGICLQAYLRRTGADVERLLSLGPAIRLVKGAYNEPTAVAFRSGPEIDANYHELAIQIAIAARDGRARLALGTHDSALIERIAAAAGGLGVPRSALEVHMLYGIRSAELRRLAQAGFPAFSLIAYGEAWYAWYMRRLAERPANVAFALRQILPERRRT